MIDWSNPSEAGVPDWRDGDGYPAKLTVCEGRWEFLRRHPRYRDEWDRVGSEVLQWWKTNESFRRSLGGDVVLIDPRKSSDGTVEFPDGSQRRIGDIFLFGDQSIGRISVTGAYSKDYLLKQFQLLDADRHAVLVFDFARNIEAQLDEAKHFLNLWAENSKLSTVYARTANAKSERTVAWPRHVRVLDALCQVPDLGPSALVRVVWQDDPRLDDLEKGKRVSSTGSSWIRDARKIQRTQVPLAEWV